MFDWFKYEFARYWWGQDVKPKRRAKQLVHKDARRLAKLDLRKKLKEYDKDT